MFSLIGLLDQKKTLYIKINEKNCSQGLLEGKFRKKIIKRNRRKLFRIGLKTNIQNCLVNACIRSVLVTIPNIFSESVLSITSTLPIL